MTKPITIQPQWITVFIPTPEASPYVRTNNTEEVAAAEAAIADWLKPFTFAECTVVSDPRSIPGSYYAQPDASTAALLLKEMMHFGLDDCDNSADRAGIPVRLPGTELRAYVGINVKQMLADLKRKRINYELTVAQVDNGSFVLT